MIATSHAVTPTDTRLPPRGALNPANLASREHSAQVMNLALQIADAAVRSDVECFCDVAQVDGRLWVDTTQLSDIDVERVVVERALKYIGLRSPDAFPWRFIRHPDRPELVRFETLP